MTDESRALRLGPYWFRPGTLVFAVVLFVAAVVLAALTGGVGVFVFVVVGILIGLAVGWRYAALTFADRANTALKVWFVLIAAVVVGGPVGLKAFGGYAAPAFVLALFSGSIVMPWHGPPPARRSRGYR